MKPAFPSRLMSKLEATWGVQKEFRLKVFFLTLSFFMLTACQAIWRPLKSAVFLSMVGVDYIPNAKMFLMLPLILLVIFYSKLVDWLRRHHLFYWFTITHGAIGIVMYFFLIHPVYGLANTTQGPSRLTGWAFYLFLESFGAFMSAVFWSFSNSVNKPNDAKNYYSLFVGGSKIGGILGAGTLLFMTNRYGGEDTTIVPIFVLIGSFMLFGAAGAIYLLMKKVPGYLMHGYEAAYQLEKKREVKESKSILRSLKESMEGLFIIIKSPYVFGIFSMILFYEVIIVIFDFIVAHLAYNQSSNVAGLAGYYAFYMLLMHSLGLIIAIFGTAPIQRFLGIRLSLFTCPILSALIIIFVLVYPTPETLFLALVALRALNYGLNHPTREALFIPTTKAVKFKAKAWTDAFGSRISKATGSLLNKVVLMGVVGQSSIFCLGLTSCWLVVTYFLGRKFQTTIDNNEVIGVRKFDEKETPEAKTIES